MFQHFRLYDASLNTVSPTNALQDNANKAKDFEDMHKRIANLNEDYTKVRKLSIHTQLIETVTERLPSMILLVTILFIYKDCKRLGHLIGMSLKNPLYNGLVILTFVSGTFGLINPLIHSRFYFLHTS